ncbi:cysteine desulfurase NifS [Pleomorphomonas diazotrophica]|uniref:Cysteine desulfurase n=1 Tax=Pleomorphomonas diazotrophica TaxID=1166257 RepID=A0A1I4RK03_9HYPH|nr:aminotransferase class V-fold PLP-dependent enzyme [Pleomorphomonas diazotrophica]PKR87524.1 cysteine desulfurase NifS [Pleomorphomonas diazotrophica]SFM52514.1 cysteine desulfurase [Pleomorphomonas diazotrophica]
MATGAIVYLDANATTPVDPRVAEAMLAALTGLPGNPSSAHAAGRAARQAVEAARRNVMALVGAERPDEIVFTSGGSESNVAAIHAALAARPGRREVVTSSVEHASVRATLDRLVATDGLIVHRLPVDASGRLDLDAYRAALGPGTALVTLMSANNETGTLFPIADLVPAAHAAGALFHTDAVQAAGRLDPSIAATGVDMASLSAHKLHGPKGAGALYIRRGTPFRSLITGGGQERGRRAGTENVPAIVGFGVAARLARADDQMAGIARLRDRLETSITAALPGTRILGDREARLANTACLAFPGADAEMMLHRLDQLGIAASSGSACAVGTAAPSHVLLAMGLEHIAGSTIRFSLSRCNTDADIDRLLAVLPGIAREARILEIVA